MDHFSRSTASALICCMALIVGCGKKNPAAPVVPAETGTLFVTVLSQNGTVVAGATVLTNPAIGNGVAHTDALGQILYEDVPTKLYSVLASHPTAGSGREVVQLEKNTVNRVTLRLLPGVHLEPSVRISQPIFSFIYSIADSINLRATVGDISDSPDSLKLQWSSHQDGVLASPRSSATGDVYVPHGALPAGARWFVLRATNSRGFVGADSVFVTVRSFAPTLQIIQPTPGAGFLPGDVIAFNAQVSDRETPADQLQVTWRSSVDGQLFSGPAGPSGRSAFNRSDLTRGLHVISVSVTDPDGNVTRDSVQVHNDLPATVALHPITTQPSGLRLDWDPVSEPAFAAFNIYRSLSSTGPYSLIASIPDGASTRYDDVTTTLGVTYWYKVGLQTTTGAESQSVARSGAAGVFVSIGRGLDRMLLDPVRRMIYGVDRVNNTLVFVNLDSLKVSKTMFIGSSPTDLDMDRAGQELFVANLGSAQIAVVNLDTRTVARNLIVDTNGIWDGNPYRLACMTAGRLAWTSFDQWNSIKLIDTATGVRVSDIGSIYQPSLTASPDGTHLYAGESGISTGHVYRFDIVNGLLAQADVSNGFGFTSPNVRMSGDGNFTYYGGKKLNSLSLRSELGTFAEITAAANFDGSLVVGDTRVFDGNTFAIIRQLPITGGLKVFGPDGHTLYSYDPVSTRLYVLDVSPPVPAPGLTLTRGRNTSATPARSRVSGSGR